jgi:Alcohol dehydrogenase GroES-like domain
LTIGHEPVGVVEKLGSGVVGFKEGQRVIAGAITPSGWSHACLCGCGSQDGAGAKHGWKAIGGWKFGNTIDGCQAEFVCVPDAMANLAPVDDGVSDEQVLMCPDIMSTGFAGAQTGEIKIGDTVSFRTGSYRAMRDRGRKAPGRENHHRSRHCACATCHVQTHGRRSRRRLPQGRFGRSNHAADGWPRRRCRHRGAGNANHVRGRTPGDPAWWRPVESRRLFLGSEDPLGRLCSGARRQVNPHLALSGRQGTQCWR